MAPPLRRSRFDAEALGDLLAFCGAHPANGFSTPLRERLLTRLVSGPDCVIDVFRGEERVLVAAAVDTLEEPADAVIVDVLGQGEVVEWAAATDMVLDAAESVARAAARPKVELNWEHPLPPAVAAALVGRGYRLTHRCYLMEREPAEAPPAPVLPAGWRWRVVDEPLVLALRRLLAESFTEFPAYFSSETEFARSVLSARIRARLLFEGETPVGLVQVRHQPGDGFGEVAQIARHPTCRGRGLGEKLLAQALRLLHADGATRMRLEVATGNERALALYRRFGFVVSRETGSYSRAAA